MRNVFPVFKLQRGRAPFLEAPETFQAPKAIFSPSVAKNGEVDTPEASRMEGTCVHIKICE